MPATLGNIALDCQDVLRTARFWSAVLGRPLDEGSSAGFATIGGTDAARSQPAWYFNLVPGPKRAKNRLHVDLVDPDEGAVERLVSLGAVVLGAHSVGPHDWTVLQDPEGNEFCVTRHAYAGSPD